MALSDELRKQLDQRLKELGKEEMALVLQALRQEQKRRKRKKKPSKK